MTENFGSGDIDVVGILVLHRIEARLDVLHLIQVLDGAFLAGGDDEALLAHEERDFGLALLELDGLVEFQGFARTGSGDLDERFDLGVQR